MNSTEDVVLKQKKNEVAAFEIRIAAAKAENEKLNRENEALKTQAEDVRARCNQEVALKMGEARKVTSAAAEEREKLDSDKKEFEAILNAFKVEKVAFDRERQAAEDMKADAKATSDRVGIFVRQMKELASKL